MKGDPWAPGGSLDPPDRQARGARLDPEVPLDLKVLLGKGVPLG